MKRHPFNLIELMLALGVIVVGLVSVMALFPVGANANRDAMAENYSAQAAEQMLNSLAYYLRSQPTVAAWTAERSKIAVLSAATVTAVQEVAAQQPIPGTDYTKDCTFLAGNPGTIFMKPTATDLKEGFRIESSGNSGYKDFEAMAAVWQEQIEVDDPKSPGTQIQVAYTFGTVLNLEISWPAQLPYSRRQKARYRLEVFNPNH